MKGSADEFARDVARQLSVRIERDNEPDFRSKFRPRRLNNETRVTRAAQCAIKFM